MRKFKMKKEKKVYIAIAVICTVVCGLTAAYVVIKNGSSMEKKYTDEINVLLQEMNSNKVMAYVAKEDIEAGELLTKDKIHKQTVYTSQNINNYITDKDIGKVTLIDICMDTQITQQMLTDDKLSNTLREVEYDVIAIGSNVKENDVVDVRIFYPNGESFVIMGKKTLVKYNADNNRTNLWVKEEEMHLMNAAIVDATLYPGANIYVTKYIDPSIQEASEITYVPNISILSLMETDPNILERSSKDLAKSVRKAQENRLANDMGVDISSENWNISNMYQYLLPAPSELPLLDFSNINKETTTTNDHSDNNSNDSVIQDGTQTNVSNVSIETGKSDLGAAGHDKYYVFAETEERIVEYGE